MASENVVAVTGQNFDQEVLQSPIPVLVDFWAPWCGPCVRLGPILDEIAGENKGAFKIAKVNVDENQELAMKFNVRSIPFVVYFKNGQVADSALGVESKDKILGRLKAIA
jgi:thioredoxin 1